MELFIEQMGEDLKYGGEVDEEKLEFEGKLWKEGEDDEEVEFKEVNVELSGDFEEKEIVVENLDFEGK